jgi:predicted MFS family arabinose efflux permease
LRHELVVAWIYLAVMAASALPTPLYPLYRQRLELSASGITAVYGFYAVVVLLTLLRLGSLADRIGRRPVLTAAVAITVLSEVVLAMSRTLAGLYLGRGLVAVAVGLAIAALPAYLADLAGPDRASRATVFAVAANMGGQALGTFAAGTTTAFEPLVTPYLIGLGMLVPAMLLWTTRVPETLPARRGPSAGQRSVKRFPPALRPDYRAIAMTIVGAFAMFGSMTAMTGQILQQRMLITGTSTTGLVTAAMFASGAIGQLAARRIATARNPAVMVFPLPVAALLLCWATLAGSVPIFAVAVSVCGFAGGSCLRAGSIRVLALSPVENRAHVSSRLFAALYLGASVCTVSAGLLATAAGLDVAMLGLGLLVLTLSAGAAVLLSRLPGTREALATTDVLDLTGLYSAEATVQFFAVPAVRPFRSDALEFPPSRGRLTGLEKLT